MLVDNTYKSIRVENIDNKCTSDKRLTEPQVACHYPQSSDRYKGVTLWKKSGEDIKKKKHDDHENHSLDGRQHAIWAMSEESEWITVVRKHCIMDQKAWLPQTWNYE